ncbi:LysE family translocator [Amycolatopsis nigrescens]|uniref:LysE family translocator n=1 Tax=Amycolatopsis nigrescens TaxID=381445 RepID=UPI000365F9A7|nr:LysE family translocator [Amycolatopsis nigrescens]
MTTVAQLVPFAGVVLLGAVAPGPDFAMVFRHAAVSGRRAGVAAAAGVTGGILVWSLVAAFGLAGLLAASATAYTVVKIVGAAYLILLGARALLAACRGGRYELPPPSGHGGAGRAFRQGLLGNVLNPKVAVFFVALLPQFLPAHATAVDTALLALVPMVITLCWYCLVATVVGAMRRLLTAAKVRRVIDAATGTLLVALGIRLAAQSRP